MTGRWSLVIRAVLLIAWRTIVELQLPEDLTNALSDAFQKRDARMKAEEAHNVAAESASAAANAETQAAIAAQTANEAEDAAFDAVEQLLQNYKVN